MEKMNKVLSPNRRSYPVVVFLSFLLLSVALRFFSFFPSVIDHDESTYLEIARELLEGKILYVDMIDIKPPGIFIILAGFQAVFGYSIFVIRLLVAIWIGLTAFIIFKTGKLLSLENRASYAAGMIYIFFISTWSFYGISITPEIFFNLFTISALYVILKKQSPVSFLIAGLLAGLGFMIKYLVLFDFTAFMIFFIVHEIRKKTLGTRKIIYSLIAAGIGFFLPFALTNYWYYHNGHFDALYNIVYLAPSRYPSPFDPWKMLKLVLDFHLRFLPVFIFFYLVLFDKKHTRPETGFTKRLCVLWSLMALVAVLLAGKTFGHYTIQLMLPVSLVGGIFFGLGRPLPAFLQRIFTGKTSRVILVAVILIISLMKLEYVIRRDVPREIASYLEPRLKPGDVIYAGNYHHILYYLLQKDSPTKYIHRSLLLKQTHIRALDINVEDEFRQIMAKKPVYIIVQKEYPEGMMKNFITDNYIADKDFGDGILVCRLIGN